MNVRERILGALAQVAIVNVPSRSERAAAERVKDSVHMLQAELYVEAALLRQAFGQSVLAPRRIFRNVGQRALLCVLVDKAFADEVLELSIDKLEQEGPPAEQAHHRRAVHLARALVQAVC